MNDPKLPGIRLDNGSSIISGRGINSKTVFADLGFPVTMHELWPGIERPIEPSSTSTSTSTSAPTSTSTSTSASSASSTLSFGGQLGLIDFITSTRLPRHVHIWRHQFIHERILVLNGVALVEMNGQMYVIPPRTLVTIAPGVPHTWTACPAGVDVDKDTTSTGSFLMLYEYEEPTSFRPTKQTQSLSSVDEYVECPVHELEAIRFPELTPDQVRQKCWFVRDLHVGKWVDLPTHSIHTNGGDGEKQKRAVEGESTVGGGGDVGGDRKSRKKRKV